MPDDVEFGPGEFKDELWIKDKRVFTKPKNVDVEFVTAGAFDWIFADKNGKEVKTAPHKNPNGGWTSMNLASFGLYDDYGIRFRNWSTGEKKIKQGTVRFS